jgi:phage terminase large subunit-like protein
MNSDPSPATLLAQRLTTALGRAQAHRAVDMILDRMAVVDVAALAYDWSGMWARPKQVAPSGEWRSWGFLTARGFGKTLAVAKHITDEVEAGRATCIGMAAQNETKTIAVQVAGLIEAAPPWFRPEWIASSLQLVWPNGARAFAFSPEVPGAIRSPNFDLAWLSELQSWPVATREEAYSNFLFATRVGYARTIWDATPKRRHPLLKKLLARADAEPDKHHVVRGTIYENLVNLSGGVIADLEREYGGTQKGQEELLGEMLQDDENGLVRQKAIDDRRIAMPARVARKAIGIDPAVTARSGSDSSGISLAALTLDDRLLVCADLTGKHEAAAWATIVLDTHEREGCDVVVVETNKGGNLLTQNLRAAGAVRGLRVVVVDKEWLPHREQGVVFVREIFSRGEKSERATPLATAYERGRVSHVLGADLRELEDVLTTWVPEAGQRSPDRLDALVHVAGELLGLASNRPDAGAAFTGITTLAAEIAPARSSVASVSLAALLAASSGGRI